MNHGLDQPFVEWFVELQPIAMNEFSACFDEGNISCISLLYYLQAKGNALRFGDFVAPCRRTAAHSPLHNIRTYHTYKIVFRAYMMVKRVIACGAVIFSFKYLCGGLITINGWQIRHNIDRSKHYQIYCKVFFEYLHSHFLGASYPDLLLSTEITDYRWFTRDMTQSSALEKIHFYYIAYNYYVNDSSNWKSCLKILKLAIHTAHAKACCLNNISQPWFLNTVTSRFKNLIYIWVYGRSRNHQRYSICQLASLVAARTIPGKGNNTYNIYK